MGSLGQIFEGLADAPPISTMALPASRRLHSAPADPWAPARQALRPVELSPEDLESVAGGWGTIDPI